MAPRNQNRRDLDDDAPWLAEAGPRAETRVSRRSLFWTLAVLFGLAAVAAIGLIVIFSKKNGGSTQGYMEAGQAPLIEAEPGPYKVPPLDPKGLQVEGQDQTLYAAGEGIDSGSVIDQSAMPEQPLPRPGATPPSAGPPQDLIPEAAVDVLPPPASPLPPPAAIAPPPIAAPKPLPKPVAKPLPKPLPKPMVMAPPPAKSGAVQLGAFSSEALANAAWAGLAARHGLGGKRIIGVESGGRTLYRLRAAAADPAATCARMKAAGDACSAVE